MKRFLIILFSLLCLASACNKFTPEISIYGRTQFSLQASASVLSVKLVTNCASWECDCGSVDWISLNRAEAGAAYLNIAANASEAERSANVTFFAPSVGESAARASITVTQAGAVLDPQIDVEQSFSVPASGEILQVPVSTNQGSWEADFVEEDTDWITLSPGRESLGMVVAPNPKEDARRAMIRIYAPGKAAMKVFKDISVSQDAAVIDYDPVNLSEAGTSNCYVITHKGVHSFNATVRGNGATTDRLAAPARLSPAGARLVWQTAKGMIKSLRYADGTITFEASRAPGSAVIAATDARGDIIWSWHIWYPSVEIEGLRCQTGDEMMNLNLGALDNAPASITSHGMLYQWGRKDPFPYSPVAEEGSVATLPVKVYDINGDEVKIGNTEMFSSKDNTLAFSIANPSCCISNNNQFSVCRDWLLPAESSAALWGNPKGDVRTDGRYDNVGEKSFYDPCPVGWRVAPVRDYQYMTESGGYTWAQGDTGNLKFYDLGGDAEVAIVDIDEDGKYTLNDYQDGWHLYLDKSAGVKSYFPSATRYDGQYAMLMGSMVGLWGNYWTNTAGEGAEGLAVALSFSLKDYSKEYSITISPVSNGSRADAYSVRCIKE